MGDWCQHVMRGGGGKRLGRKMKQIGGKTQRWSGEDI